MKIATTLMMSLLLLGAASAQAQLASKKGMTLEAAKQIAAAAEAEARKNKWNVVIAIVDDGANLVYLQKMDETQIGSIEVAQEKARTAVKFKRPSKAFEDAVKGGRQVVLKLPGALPVEGGIPLMLDGRVVGAIGVSGVQSNEDGIIAAAGVEAFGKMK
ncbi:MAG: heme-binding protein [Acidobacteria bacterium]|nr:heme-binding protein [Acidobacteriota bacterium]